MSKRTKAAKAEPDVSAVPAKRTSNHPYHLLARSIVGASNVQLWLIRTDGQAESGILHGEVLPATVDDLAKALGLDVVRETRDYKLATTAETPTAQPATNETPPDLAGTEKTLFDDLAEQEPHES